MISKLNYFYNAISATHFCSNAWTDNDSIPENRDNILFFKDPRVDVLQKMYMRKSTSKKQAIRVQIFSSIRPRPDI